MTSVMLGPYRDPKSPADCSDLVLASGADAGEFLLSAPPKTHKAFVLTANTTKRIGPV